MQVYASTVPTKGLEYRLVLAYPVHWGLCNQLTEHVHGMAIADVLGADIILPPAWRRTYSYAKRFSPVRKFPTAQVSRFQSNLKVL